MPLDRATLQRALALAAHAPSPHNTQPWLVEVEPERLVIRDDPERHLRHTDPAGRDLQLALGGFTEAVGIALRSHGVAAERADAPAGAVAAYRLGPGEPSGLARASLLRQRQTSRLPYSPRQPAAADLEKLVTSARAAGLELHLAARGSPEFEAFAELLFAASRESWLDVRATEELARWVKLDPEGLRRPPEGLSTHCLNLGLPEALALRALLRPRLWRALEAAFAAPALAEALAREDVRQMRAAPLLALAVAQNPGLEAGASLLGTWLAATEQGWALHPLSVLLDRRGWEVGKRLGVDPRRLVLAARLGRSAPAPRSGRLPVERFARFVG